MSFLVVQQYCLLRGGVGAAHSVLQCGDPVEALRGLSVRTGYVVQHARVCLGAPLFQLVHVKDLHILRYTW